MGASAWSHTTAYHPNIQVAYHNARQEAFENGDYFRWWEFYTHETKPDPFPTTIEELLECAGMDGTHSILDYSDQAKLYPCSAEILNELIGTTTPTQAMIDAMLKESDWNRLDGGYFIGYDGDQPVTITFIGISGD